MKISPYSRQAFYVAGTYLVFGILWIFFSDRILAEFVSDPAALTSAQTWKGWAYVLFTAFLLYGLARSALRRHAHMVHSDFEIEKRIRDISELAPVGIYHMDAAGSVTYINDMAAAMAGRPAEKLLGTQWGSAVHEEDRERVLAIVGGAIERGEGFRLECRLRHNDGTVVWVMGAARAQKDGRGTFMGFVGTAIDITERKRAELALDKLRDRLQLAAQAGNVGLWDWDLGTNKVYYSPEWKRQIGCRDDEIGDDFDEWQSRVHPDDLDRAMQASRDFIENPRPGFSVEFRFRHKDGSYRWILAQAALLHDDKGKPVRMLGTHVDITDRKVAEMSLRLSERRYRSLASLSPAGIYHSDASGQLTYANARLAQIAGLPAEALTGEGWVPAVHEVDRERVLSNWNNAVAKASEFHDQYRFRHADGSVIWVVENSVPEKNESGQLDGYIGTLMDITALKQAEISARASESYRRLIVDMEPECIKLVSPEGNLMEMNPAGLAMVEADSLEQVVGRKILQLVAPGDRAAFTRLHERVMRGESGNLEFDAVGLKGTRRRLETQAVPFRNESGAIVALLGVTRDITERRRAEQDKKESESHYRDLFDSNPNLMCVYDRETLRFLAVNDAMVAHYGYSRDEFLRMTIKDIRPPEDIPALLEQVSKAGPSMGSAGTWRHRKKNGQLIDVAVRSHTLTFTGHDATVALMTDVTEQLAAEAALAREQAALREASARLNHILTTSPTLLYSVRLKDGKFTPIWVSDNIERLLGYSNEESLQPDWWLLNLHPEDRERVAATMPLLVANPAYINEFRFLKKNRQVVWIRSEVRRLSLTETGDAEFVGSWSDITDERKTEERLRLDAAAFESTRDGVMIADLESRILSVNRAFLEVTGYTEAELLGRSPRIFQSGRHQPDFYQSLWSSLQKAGFWRGEIWNRRKNGEVFPVWLTISAVYDNSGEPTHYVAIYTDISKLKETEERLQHLAHFDPLTGLPNRLLFQSRLEHAIEQARRRAGHVSILYIDLDDFKKVNDSLGHVVGDELLIEVAKRFRIRTRGEDTLARLGGDEFVVLLETLDRPESAATVAQGLLSSLASPLQLSGGRELHVHGSIGISIFPNDGSVAAEILRAADTAMYRAKDAGGDRFLFFTSEMGAEVLASTELESALRKALERGDFQLYYQPKVDLRSGRMQGAEALLRWQRDGVGMVGPNQFIPVAERTGLIVPLGNWVFDAACRQFRSWVDQGLPEVHIAVNVSARQFHSADLESNIAAALRRHRMPPEFLTLELTESMLMERVEETSAILRSLKGIGVKLSLDDFGTGFSSLAYLTRFPIDTLKIDASFVKNVGTDPSAMTIVNTIIELAHRMGMNAVAEGVEMEAQYTYLRGQGCDEMQGYYFSKPLPVPEFEKLLREKEPRPLHN